MRVVRFLCVQVNVCEVMLETAVASPPGVGGGARRSGVGEGTTWTGWEVRNLRMGDRRVGAVVQGTGHGGE